ACGDFIIVTTERIVIIHLACNRTISIHSPFAHVASHVVQAEGVGLVGIYRSSVVGIVVERTGDTHLVAMTALEVTEEFTLLFVTQCPACRVVGAPGENVAVSDYFFTATTF